MLDDERQVQSTGSSQKTLAERFYSSRPVTVAVEALKARGMAGIVWFMLNRLNWVPENPETILTRGWVCLIPMLVAGIIESRHSMQYESKGVYYYYRKLMKFLEAGVFNFIFFNNLLLLTAPDGKPENVNINYLIAAASVSTVMAGYRAYQFHWFAKDVILIDLLKQLRKDTENQGLLPDTKVKHGRVERPTESNSKVIKFFKRMYLDKCFPALTGEIAVGLDVAGNSLLFMTIFETAAREVFPKVDLTVSLFCFTLAVAAEWRFGVLDKLLSQTNAGEPLDEERLAPIDPKGHRFDARFLRFFTNLILISGAAGLTFYGGVDLYSDVFNLLYLNDPMPKDYKLDVEPWYMVLVLLNEVFVVAPSVYVGRGTLQEKIERDSLMKLAGTDYSGRSVNLGEVKKDKQVEAQGKAEAAEADRATTTATTPGQGLAAAEV